MARGYLVQPRSTVVIRALAQQTLDGLGMQGRRVPILHVIENVMPMVDESFSFEAMEAEEMTRRFGYAAEGMTVHSDNLIVLRDDVYMAAFEGNGRHRFTAAHELGHYFMHRREGMAGIAFLRKTGPTEKIYRDSEWQADTYARELLADIRYCVHFDGPESVAAHFGVSMQVAQIQWAEAKKMAR